MSTIQVNAIQSSTGTQEVTQTTIFSGTAKAWASYESSPSTAFLQSFAISSLTDQGTGITDFNLSSSFAASEYSLSDSGGDNNSGYSSWTNEANIVVDSYRLLTGNATFNVEDTAYHSGQAFGDLA